MPGPVTLIVDTREQQPFAFSAPGVRTIRRALPTGDYSVEGFEDRVAVERKTLDDLVGSLIRARERFLREMRRFETYEARCIVVEADWSDVAERRYAGGVHPKSIFGAVLSVIVDHGVPVYFLSNRQIACRFTEDFLLRFHRKATEPCQQPQPEVPTV
jgi:ERCC4-type nuclease